MIYRLVFTILLYLISIAVHANEKALQPFVVESLTIDDKFNQPTAVATDSNGDIYVLDALNDRIVVLNSSGKRLRSISGHAFDYSFKFATGIHIDDDRLFIANSANASIDQLSLNGAIKKRFHLPVRPPEVSLPEPVWVIIDNDRFIYSDRQNHRLCFESLLEMPSTANCVGQRGEGETDFQAPFQITADRDGYYYTVDVLNGRVQIFNRKGLYFSSLGHFGTGESDLFRPNGIAIDALDFVYISDAYTGTVSIFKGGKFISRLTDASGQIIHFKSATSLWFGQNFLYVVDALDSKVHRMTLNYHDLMTSEGNNTSEQIELSQKKCTVCHTEWTQKTNIILDQESVTPVSSMAMCYSCHHGAVVDSRHALPGGAQHPTVYDSDQKKSERKKNKSRKDALPESFPVMHENELMCNSCHTPHTTDQTAEALYSDHRNAWMRESNDGSEICEQCHTAQAKNARSRNNKIKGINHPLSFSLAQPETDQPLFHSKDPHLQKGLSDTMKKGHANIWHQDRMICQTCHQVHGGIGKDLLTVAKKDAELCTQCHRRQSSKGEKDAHRKGIHPINTKLEKPVKFNGQRITRVTCFNCHDVHGGNPGTDLFPKAFQTAEEMCPVCHKRQHAKDEKDAKRKGIHPVNVKLKKPVEIDGQKIEKVGCLSCHSVHKGVKNTPALRQDHINGKLCENCHKGKSSIVGTDHDLRITAKKSQNRYEESPKKSGVCGTCHTLHRGKGERPYLSSAEKKATQKRDKSAPKLERDELCLNCHQDKGVAKDSSIEHYGHPFKDIVLRSNTKIMPLLDGEERVRKMGAIACITCHEPHHWEPAPPGQTDGKNYRFNDNQSGSVLNSFLRTKGVKDTFCVECHGLESMPKYKYFHHPDKVRDIGVDYLD